ncbi:MAG: hypothetical protein JKZ00_00940 [Flavobacteriaceae bacterium]|nr:hypothetical protein [Flavobacteriaceae bacterium]
MKTEKTALYTVLTSDENSFADFFESFNATHTGIENEHIIIELSENLNSNFEQISLFLNCAVTHKSNGTSFAVVCSGIDIDLFPETFNIVPTLTEAIDVIEMEAIERDLGF